MIHLQPHKFALVVFIPIQLSGCFHTKPTRVTFRLFTNIVSRIGHKIDTHHGNYSSTPWESFALSPIRDPLPIRRDLMPNNLPLHSGMGYFTNPTLFQANNTLVSMLGPFSAVCTFTRANFFSSTHSRSQ